MDQQLKLYEASMFKQNIFYKLVNSWKNWSDLEAFLGKAIFFDQKTLTFIKQFLKLKKNVLKAWKME